jgi:hypothetical protein
MRGSQPRAVPTVRYCPVGSGPFPGELGVARPGWRIGNQPAPTHPPADGQVVRGRVVQADQEWLVERFDQIGTRLLVDVVLRQEQRLTEHLRLISTKVDFLNQVDESTKRSSVAGNAG